MLPAHKLGAADSSRPLCSSTMKHLPCALLGILSVVFFAACGESSVAPADEPDPDDPQDPVAEVATVVASADSILIPAIGFSRSATVSVLDASGATPSGVSVTWGSRNPIVAGVDDVGRIEGRALGQAAVIVTAGAVSDTIIVTVVQVPETIVIEQDVDTLDAIGVEAQLLVSAWDSTGVSIPPLEGTWTSSDTALAGIDMHGRITFHRSGTATFEWTRFGQSASAMMTLRQVGSVLRLEGGASSLAPGDTTTILASLHDAVAGEIADAEIVWSTSDSSVATVTQQGLVTAIGGGGVLIEGESQGLVGQRALAVAHPVPPSGTLSASPALLEADAQGERFFLMAHVDDGGGSPVAVPATWLTRDPRVARLIEGGLVRAEEDGQTWLVAQYDGRTDSVSIVVDRAAVGISFQGAPSEVTVDFSEEHPVMALPVDRLGAVVDGSAVWTVREPMIATWSGTGFAAQSVGTTWAVVEAAGQTDSIRVTVIPRYDADYAIDSPEDLAWLEERSIEHIGGALGVIGSSVANLDGLESILTLGSVYILENDLLTDLDGLANVTEAGGITIEGNPALANVSLPSVTSAASLSIRDNLAVDRAVFDALRTVDGPFHYAEAGSVASFPRLMQVGSLDITSPGPSEMSFPLLEVVIGNLRMIDVSATVLLSAPKLWRVQNLTVTGNENLTTLALPSLTTIELDLEVWENPSLTDLSSMSITSGLRNLLLRDNIALTSLSGLEGLGDALGSDPVVTEELRVARHPSLSTAVIEAIFSVIEEKFPGVAFLRGVLIWENG